MKTKLNTLLENAFATRSPEDDRGENRTSHTKLGAFLGIAFASALLGTGLLRMAAHGGGQVAQAATPPQVTGVPSNVQSYTEPERPNAEPKRPIEELEARRSGALREAVELSERLSKLRASRIEQLEADLEQARLEVQSSNQKIKALEEDRNQAARSTRQALKKVIEKLDS